MKRALLLLLLPLLASCDADILFNEDCQFSRTTGVFEILEGSCSSILIDTHAELLPLDQEFLITIGFGIPMPAFQGQTFTSSFFQEDGSIIGVGDFEVYNVRELSDGRWRLEMSVFGVGDPSFGGGELIGGIDVDTLSESGVEPF